MSITEKLPAMSDQDLTTLRANAVRLEQSGTPKQRQDAALLIPAIEAEIDQRKTARPQPVRAAAAAAPRRRAAKRG